MQTGENVKVVWAEFSTLSFAILLCVQLHGIYMQWLRVASSAQVSSCLLKFVRDPGSGNLFIQTMP
jgi:hypothetical protein